ncbi:MAG: hypothetical protein ABIQ53_03795 [Terracoccus sp.]
MTSDWRADLGAAVARGMAEEGWDAVVDALGEQAEQLAVHPDAPIEPLTPDAPVLALIGCESGRLGVLVGADGRVSVHLGRATAAVLDQVRENTEPALLVFTGDIGAEAAGRSDVATETVDPYEGSASLEERRESLRLAGLEAPGWFSGSGFTESELLDACGAVVVAVGRTGRMGE